MSNPAAKSIEMKAKITDGEGSGAAEDSSHRPFAGGAFLLETRSFVNRRRRVGGGDDGFGSVIRHFFNLRRLLLLLLMLLKNNLLLLRIDLILL